MRQLRMIACVTVMVTAALLAAATVSAQAGGRVRVTRTATVMEQPRGDSLVLGSIAAGAMLQVLDSAFEVAQREQQDKANGQFSMFGATPAAAAQPDQADEAADRGLLRGVLVDVERRLVVDAQGALVPPLLQPVAHGEVRPLEPP